MGSHEVEVCPNRNPYEVNSVDIPLSAPISGSCRNGKGQSLVMARKLSASWTYERDDLILDSITFEVNQDSRLLAVVGPVGAGKVISNSIYIYT